MTAHRWADDVGSVADEAGRLLESLRRAGADAASEAAADARADAGADAPADPAASTTGPDRDGGPHEGPGATGAFTCDDPVCQWCPVCRASAFVRRLSPETLSGLSELAGFAAAVLADLATARAGEQGGGAPEDGRD